MQNFFVKDLSDRLLLEEDCVVFCVCKKFSSLPKYVNIMERSFPAVLESYKQLSMTRWIEDKEFFIFNEHGTKVILYPIRDFVNSQLTEEELVSKMKVIADELKKKEFLENLVYIYDFLERDSINKEKTFEEFSKIFDIDDRIIQYIQLNR